MKPDLSALLHWKNDRVTQWVIGEVNRKFPASPTTHCHKTLEEQHRVAGTQQVLDFINSIVNDKLLRD